MALVCGLLCMLSAAAEAVPPTLSRAALLAPGEAKPLAPGEAKLTPRQLARALRYNNREWTGAHRREILGWLRDRPVKAGTGDALFRASDVQLIARMQRSAGMSARTSDGRFGRASSAVALLAGLELSARRVSARRIELWFYPGSFEDLARWRRAARRAADVPVAARYRAVTAAAPAGAGLVYVVIDDKVVDLIDARGGPPFRLASGSHTADPSKPGRYRLARGKAHRSNNWIYSQIPWGAELRERAGELQYLRRVRGKNRWQWATGPKSRLTHVLPREDFYETSGSLMKTWRLNDFGARAWRLRGSPGLLIHTTPHLEETAARGADPTLPPSHGCVHVKPGQRDRLVERGYLRRGVTVVIKRYRDHLLPRKVREKVARHRGS